MSNHPKCLNCHGPMTDPHPVEVCIQNLQNRIRAAETREGVVLGVLLNGLHLGRQDQEKILKLQEEIDDIPK